MIEISHILPTEYLGKVTPHKVGRKTHLLLAHQVLKDTKYTSYFLEKKKKGDYLILDNSAFEFGEALDNEKLLRAIEKCKPDEMVLPDKLRDGLLTLRRSLGFIKHAKKNLDLKFMAVIQGNSLEDWLVCYRQFAANKDVLSIGLGAIYGRDVLFGKPVEPHYLNGRVYLTTLLNDHRIVQTDKPHHLLGLGDFGNLELQIQKVFPWIRSCDSSAAYVNALHGIKFQTSGTYTKIRNRINLDATFDDRFLGTIQNNIEILDESGK